MTFFKEIINCFDFKMKFVLSTKTFIYISGKNKQINKCYIKNEENVISLKK